MNKLTTNNFYRYQIVLEYVKKQRENVKFIQSIEVGITFCLSSFFLFFAIKPTSLTISSLMGEIKTKQVLVQKMRTKINDVIESQDVFSQVQNNYQIIDSCLPDNPRYSQGLAQIKGISDIIGNTDKIPIGLAPEPIDNSLSPNQFSISIDRHTNFNDLLTLIKTINQNRRLMVIDSLNITSLDSEKSEELIPGENIQVSTSLKLFYSKPQNGKN